jgi:UDP-glucose 4-epimerase
VAWDIQTPSGFKERTYALEGSAFVAGAAVQWLRDNLKSIKSAPEVSELAYKVTDLSQMEHVLFMPFFTGIGTPYWNSQAKNYQYCITDYTMTRKLYEHQDVVFHMAAESRIQNCISDPLKAVETNLTGTATVLQCARVCGVKRVIYSSTSSAYGLANPYPNIETMPTDCLNPYSVTKVGGEELCKMYSRLFGLQTIIFRYFNVYGERQPLKGQYAPVIGIFIRQKSNGEPLTVVGDGKQRRDFTHVSDVVEANILAGKFVAPEYDVVETDYCSEYRRWEWGQVYNIGTGTNHSVNDIAVMVGGETTNIPSRLGEARVTMANTEKANKHFGWKAKVSLEDWLSSHT